MFDTHRVEIEWGGRKLSLETGRVARQADAAVFAQYGETSVLATVVAAKSARPGIDFFPLTVNYQEKTYAAGKIPGGFFKREGRPSEKETLTSRLIDRPIRPLFVEGFKHETQVVVTVLSHDMENDPDIVALVAASAALTLSGVPFLGPIGGRPRRRDRRPVRAQSDGRRDGQERSRPGRGRHRRCGHDGGVRGQGTAREADARGRHVRPSRLSAGDQCDHQAGREGGEGAVGFPAARCVQIQGQGQGAGRGRPAQGLRDPRKAEAPRTGRSRQRQGQEGAAAGRRGCQRAGAAGLGVQEPRIGGRARRHHQDPEAHRRPRPQDRAAHRFRSARAAAHARLGAVHARRDAGHRGCHARHRR